MKKRRGFTLIELLVVITIIAVLLAILMPSLRKARNQAREVVCRSNLKHWGAIFAMYVDDNHGWVFDNFIDGIRCICASKTEYDPNNPMSTNAKNKTIGLCPMASKKPSESNGFFAVAGRNQEMSSGISGSTYEAWEIKNGNISYYSSYGFNSNLFHASSRTASVSAFQNVYHLKRANRFPILLDSQIACGSLKTTSEYLPNTFCIDRHDGGINGLFFDWSVRKVGLKELWTLKWNEDFDTANPMTLAGGVQPEDWPDWMRKYKDY